MKKNFCILYLPRSGSTFLANLLSKHFDVFIPPESDLPKNLHQFLLSDLSCYSSSECKNKLLSLVLSDRKVSDIISTTSLVEKINSITDFSPQSIQSFLFDCIDNYMLSNNVSSSGTFGFKRGELLRHSRLYGYNIFYSKSIFIRRKAKSVFASQKSSISTSSNKPFCDNVVKFSYRFVCYYVYLYHFFRSRRQDLLVVSYEQITRDHFSLLCQISLFLGIPFDQTSPESNTNQYILPSKYSSLHSNINSPPIKLNDKWRHMLSFPEILICEMLDIISFVIVQSLK